MIRVEMGRSKTGRLLEEKLSEINVRKDVVVNWQGAPLAHVNNVLILNSESTSDKLRQAVRLRTAGVPTIEVSLNKEGVDWMPRRIHHSQGYDFTNRQFIRNAERHGAEFWVKKENIVDEFRIHVFRTNNDNMRVLRVAHRVPSRPDHHPWVRSHRLGWKLSYVGGASAESRTVARNAVRALHLDFGAVDIGVLESGTPIVLEVNTCPGMDDGGTLDAYVEAIVERARA